LELPIADRPATLGAFMFKACHGKNVQSAVDRNYPSSSLGSSHLTYSIHA